MSDLPEQNEIDPPKRTLFTVLRNYFFTGLVVSAPIFVSVYLIVLIIGFFDSWFKPLIPLRYRPDYYLPFDIPGTGVIMAVIILILIGGLTANLFGRTVVGMGDRLMKRMPVIGSVYGAVKQILKTAVSQDSSSFKQVALVEYPRKGLHCIAFVTQDADARVNKGAGKKTVGVFLPTTPNPTSGFLLFVPKEDLVILDMTVEEAARMIISAGLSEDDAPET